MHWRDIANVSIYRLLAKGAVRSVFDIRSAQVSYSCIIFAKNNEVKMFHFVLRVLVAYIHISLYS